MEVHVVSEKYCDFAVCRFSQYYNTSSSLKISTVTNKSLHIPNIGCHYWIYCLLHLQANYSAMNRYTLFTLECFFRFPSDKIAEQKVHYKCC